MRSEKRTHRTLRKYTGLVESSLSVLGAVQRNAHHEHLGRRVLSNLRDRLGQQPAQPFGGRLKPVVLKGMERRSHSVLIKPERHGAHKRRRFKTAGKADGSRR